MPSDETNPHENPSATEIAADNSNASPESDEPTTSADRSQATRIRIGSQRWSQRDPSAKPKPATTWRQPPPAPPASPGSPATAVADAPPSGNSSAPSAAASQPAPPAAHDAGPSAPTASAAPPAQTAVAAASAPPAADPLPTGKPIPHRTAPTPATNVPLPNLRAPLSAELEQELADALGEESLDEILAGSAPTAAATDLEPETRIKARVVSYHRDDVFLDLGAGRQGVVTFRSFTGEPPAVGSMLEVQVAQFNATEGLYECVLPGGAISVEDWSQISEGMVVEARITATNKGGLECEVNHLRGFIPASQASMYRVEDLSQYVGQKLRAVVTEVNPDKHRLVLSPRAVMERDKAEAKTKLLTELEVGQVREGVVRSLQEFGAFVDIGGIDGLVHISQLSWDRIRHASEVLEVGQKIKVKVQKIDPETGKIGLAFRDLAENPWDHATTKYPTRSTVSGTVTRMMEFGAFVRLESGIEGLIHVSELSHKRVWRPSDILTEGQQVEVLVLSVDAQQQRISLSLKALEARPSAPAKVEEPEEEPAPVVAPRRHVPLKGGTGGKSGGDKFGLKW